MKNKKNITIGLPRALLYFKYHIFWENFFQNLGCSVVISDETNKEILLRGSQLSVDESCLSLKVFIGHIDNLISKKVEYIFIPRIVSLHSGEKLCVKFMALNDIVSNIFDNVKILEYTVNHQLCKYEFFGIIKIARQLGFNFFKAIKSYFFAKKKEKEYFEKELEKQQRILNEKNDKPRILIVSHPYTTYDNLIGKPIIKILESQNVQIVYCDIVDKKKARIVSKNISNDLYWTYNKEQLGAIELYKEKIDGIVFLMVFPCGPDSLVINLCQNKIFSKPIMVLTLDELQGEAGLQTRLESFIDILKFKSGKIY
jgi:predicted nucleotide-binding protein (sugar kinase/HSP70/actin superfamily)